MGATIKQEQLLLIKQQQLNQKILADEKPGDLKYKRKQKVSDAALDFSFVVTKVLTNRLLFSRQNTKSACFHGRFFEIHLFLLGVQMSRALRKSKHTSTLRNVASFSRLQTIADFKFSALSANGVSFKDAETI